MLLLLVRLTPSVLFHMAWFHFQRGISSLFILVLENSVSVLYQLIKVLCIKWGSGALQQRGSQEKFHSFFYLA